MKGPPPGAEDLLSPRLRPAGPSAAAVRGRASGRVSTYAEAVSDGLRRIDSPLLSSRRTVGGLALGAAAALTPVALYQLGLLRTVPELPLPFLGSDAVSASGAAYRLLGTPDALLGIISSATTAALAATGPPDRAETSPGRSLLLAGKVALDAASGAYLLARQVSRHGRLCSWRTAGTAVTFAMLPHVVPETRTALAALAARRAR